MYNQPYVQSKSCFTNRFYPRPLWTSRQANNFIFAFVGDQDQRGADAAARGEAGRRRGQDPESGAQSSRPVFAAADQETFHRLRLPFEVKKLLNWSAKEEAKRFLLSFWKRCQRRVLFAVTTGTLKYVWILLWDLRLLRSGLHKANGESLNFG